MISYHNFSANGPKRLVGALRPPPPSDFQFESTENWDEDDDDHFDATAALINLCHAHSDARSVVHEFPEQSGIAATR